MEIQKKKCSLDEHKDIDSKTFCMQCNIYMCNKCETFHAKLFPNHQIFNSENDTSDIFIGFCKEKDHFKKLDFFCKTHNQLCCGLCIAKIIGKHHDCNICKIEEIKDEKINKIKENIQYLKELNNSLKDSINEIKSIFEKINENKEEIKTSIQKVFTKLRTELNNREDELLSEVDKKFDQLYCNEKIVKDSEKLPNKIKDLIEKAENAKEIKENKLSSFINDCINIEKSIMNIEEINNCIKNCKINNNQKIQFIPDDYKEVKEFLENIKKFGKLGQNNYFKIINNPWTNERFKYNNVFYYTLKEDNYFAEKTQNNSYIHIIKSEYQLKKDKIYKLEFDINYLGGDYEIGFADFSTSTLVYWLNGSDNSVCVSNRGLIINKKNINNNIKIENGKKYEFIIDMKNKNFILNINGNKFGEFQFNFQDNVFAQACLRNLGNSVRIKTYEKEV